VAIHRYNCHISSIFVRVFRQLRYLMANIYWTKLDTGNRAKTLESTKGLLRCPIFHELWSTNGLKPNRSFTHPHYFVPFQSIAHPLCGINVAPTATLNETALVLPEAQIWSPKRCWVRNAIASCGLQWQYIAIIATFSS